MKRQKLIIELFVYSFILIIAIILLVTDKQEPMAVDIHPDFTLYQGGKSNAIISNE